MGVRCAVCVVVLEPARQVRTSQTIKCLKVILPWHVLLHLSNRWLRNPPLGVVRVRIESDRLPVAPGTNNC